MDLNPEMLAGSLWRVSLTIVVLQLCPVTCLSHLITHITLRPMWACKTARLTVSRS